MKGYSRSLILDVAVEIVFHTILLVSLWLLFVGHNQPGGGFIGGLVAGLALVLRYVAGRDPTPRVQPETLMGLGVALAALTGIVPLFFGHELLESGKVEIDLPVLGTLKAFSVLFFDAGVYLVVVGLTLAEIRVLGGEGGRRA